jgi:hypothetical protein
MEDVEVLQEMQAFKLLELIRILSYKNAVGAWEEYICAVEDMPQTEFLKDHAIRVLAVITDRLDYEAEERSYMQAIEASC